MKQGECDSTPVLFSPKPTRYYLSKHTLQTIHYNFKIPINLAGSTFLAVFFLI